MPQAERFSACGMRSLYDVRALPDVPRRHLLGAAGAGVLRLRRRRCGSGWIRRRVHLRRVKSHPGRTASANAAGPARGIAGDFFVMAATRKENPLLKARLETR